MKMLLFFLLVLISAVAFALGGNPIVTFKPKLGAFPLISKGVRAWVFTDPHDWPGVSRTAMDLNSDLSKVSGLDRLVDDETPRIIAGTLGKNEIVDGLVKSGKLDVSAIRGKWEASVTQVVDVPQLGRCLVIAGADKRGTIYGLYDISQAIGVSPWYWWADVPIKHHDAAYISGRYVAKSPAVKYRGIFINDEAPSLSNWVRQKFGDYNSKFYEHVFEVLLRLRANYLWPAMWNNSVSVDDRLNPELADRYGIVMGTSHVEPMMRADKEWNRLGFTEREWNYSTNAKELEKFWTEGVVRNKPYENIVTIGMRGKVDTPMSETANISLLEKIVAAQRHILAENVNSDLTQIPQLWCLYKEVQEYYEKGMKVPDDVTLLWADDNWGDIRRLPTPDERGRSGGAGVYYHFDYVGEPRNYKWIDTNPIPKIWEQMNLAHKYGADRIWIVNVGDFKPKPFPIEFFLTMAQDPDAIKKEDLAKFTEAWAAREFGPRFAGVIAKVIADTGRLNGMRKPELVAPETYSLIHYREAERVSEQFTSVLKLAESVGKQLPAEYQSAYFQTVIHTIKAPKILADLYIAAAKNALYYKQGRAATNREYVKVRTFFDQDADITKEYHSINKGKWNHMMDQTHIGYTYWQEPPQNNIPKAVLLELPQEESMGVAVEGSTESWPGSTGRPRLEFTRFGQSSQRIEVFVRGTKGFSYQATTDSPWLRFQHPAGVLDDKTLESTIEVSIDWSKVSGEKSHGSVTVTGAGRTIDIDVQASAPIIPNGIDSKAFLEGDGVIAIEAEHTSRRIAAGGVKWETIPGYGRTLSAVSTFPVEYKPFKPSKGPQLEYKVVTFTGNKATLILDVSPSLAFQPGQGLRLAVAFDDAKPQVIDAAPVYLSRDWEKAVSDAVHQVRTVHDLGTGSHMLKIWAIDPGVVIQRLTIDLGGLKPSYLGPPESRRSGQ